MKDFEEFENSENSDNEENNAKKDNINPENNSESRINRDEEIRRMAEEADKNNERQLDFFGELPIYNEEELKDFFGNMQNPSESYRLYYGIRKILMNYLPKGKENESLRNMIYEQKNIFLTQGKVKDVNGFRGGDSRMALIDTELNVVLEKVKEWANHGAQTFDIFLSLRDLNIEKGYLKND
ncbi:hypothetical protein [Adhaeribacter aquaticus]|uniref:hypothetical protein n=1 Tax=Adhaeribacter aquaticus TaxID=299567 RepID=UPI0003F7CB28|nr:hypothetical protein [Adhaeribacter aquaticus]